MEHQGHYITGMSNRIVWWGGQRPDLTPMTELGANAMPGHLGIEFVECGDDWIRARMHEAGNEGRSEPRELTLPQRIFVKPIARALIE